MSLARAFLLLIATFSSSAAMAEDVPFADRGQLRAWGECLAKANIKPMRDFLKSGDTGKWVKGWAGDSRSMLECLPDGRSLRMNGISIANPIAEYLLRRDFGLDRELVWTDQAEELERGAASALVSGMHHHGLDATQTAEYNYLGICLLKVDATRSLALLKSKIDTSGERAVLSELSGSIASCRANEPANSFSPDEIRGAIATMAYRMLSNTVREKSNA